MTSARSHWAWGALTVGSILVLASSAAAQTVLTGPPGGIDDVLKIARDSTPMWIERLMPFAWRVFFAGAGCELIYKLAKAKFSGELTTVVETLIFFVLRKGLWAFVLVNVETIGPAVVLSLQQAGSAASSHLGGGITPQRIVNGLRELARVQTEGLSSWNVLRSVEVLFGLIVVCLSFGLCAVFAWLAWFRAYIVLGAGSIMLGFAGTIWTEDLAKRYLQYAVGAGLHLLVIELLKGLFFSYLDNWIVWAQHDQHWGFDTALKMLLSSLAILAALISIPGFVAGIAHGNLSFAADAAAVAATAKAVTTTAGMLGAGVSKLDAGMGKLVESIKAGLSSSSSGGGGQAAKDSSSSVGVEVVERPSTNAIAAFDAGDSPRLASGGGGDGAGTARPGGDHGPRNGGGNGADAHGPGSVQPPSGRRPGLLLGAGDQRRTLKDLFEDDEGSS